MGNIFSRTTSDQLREIKPFLLCAAQKADLISFSPEREKKSLMAAVCHIFESYGCVQACWSSWCHAGMGQFVSGCSKESGITEDFLVVSECAVKSSEKSNWLRASEKPFPSLQRWWLNSSQLHRHQSECGQTAKWELMRLFASSVYFQTALGACWI